MTPAERVYAVLRGELPDQTPFTMYENHLTDLPYADRLRHRGLCLVKRVKSYNIECNDTKIYTENITQNGQPMQRTIISTTCGDLEQLRKPAGFTSWAQSSLFKSEDDYPLLAAYLSDYHITENTAENAALYKAYQDCPDVVIRDSLPLEPMQELMRIMGTENFCCEWIENQDEILHPYHGAYPQQCTGLCGSI